MTIVPLFCPTSQAVALLDLNGPSCADPYYGADYSNFIVYGTRTKMNYGGIC